jgi:hypothetical protein
VAAAGRGAAAAAAAGRGAAVGRSLRKAPGVGAGRGRLLRPTQIITRPMQVTTQAKSPCCCGTNFATHLVLKLAAMPNVYTHA